MSFSRFISLSLALVLASQGLLIAQPDIKDLSAEERIELAEREMQQAALDNRFLTLMDSAHYFFQEGYLDKALNKYQKAKSKRPNNVYPPVKIEDVKLAMKDSSNWNREPEKEEDQENDDLTASNEPEWEKPNREKWEKEEKERLKKVEEWEQQIRRDRERKRERDKEDEESLKNNDEGTDVSRMSVEQFRKELANTYPQGVTETNYREGSRQITKRVVVMGDEGDSYKRVEHAWGGVFYFKNGDPITEDTWNRETRR